MPSALRPLFGSYRVNLSTAEPDSGWGSAGSLGRLLAQPVGRSRYARDGASSDRDRPASVLVGPGSLVDRRRL